MIQVWLGRSYIRNPKLKRLKRGLVEHLLAVTMRSSGLISEKIVIVLNGGIILYIASVHET